MKVFSDVVEKIELIHFEKIKMMLNLVVISKFYVNLLKMFLKLYYFERMVRGSCNYTLNSCFAILYNIKMHLGEKIFYNL